MKTPLGASYDAFISVLTLAQPDGWLPWCPCCDPSATSVQNLAAQQDPPGHHLVTKPGVITPIPCPKRDFRMGGGLPGPPTEYLAKSHVRKRCSGVSWLGSDLVDRTCSGTWGAPIH